jgi:hypothetical protein
MAKRRKTAPSVPKLSKHHREVVPGLKDLGATDITVTTRSKHWCLSFIFNGRRQFTTLASTTDDLKATQAAYRNIRHQLALVAANENRARSETSAAS